MLTLRAGGEIVCDRALIVRFAPDEVPYPEPADAGGRSGAASRRGRRRVPYGEIIDRRCRGSIAWTRGSSGR